MSLVAAVSDMCSRYGYEKTYWVGYSGGLDSHVLLSICHTLQNRYPIKFRAIHINHGINANAKLWAKHCKGVCAALHIDYVERSIQIIKAPGISLEALAREKRYAIFAEQMGEGDVLLTAHHQDDQAETILMQLFRGAGPKGLAAMPIVRTFARGIHLRPLLAFQRSELQAYANSYQLKWIEDESNQNAELTRNFIRHEIMPSLKTRWPTIAKTISRTANHCAEAETLLSELTEETLTKTMGSRSNTLSITKLLQLSSVYQKLILRSFIRKFSYPLPDAKKIETILHNVLTAAQDKSPCVHWAGFEIRRYRDDLFLMPQLLTHEVNRVFEWNLNQSLTLANIGTLSGVMCNRVEKESRGFLLRADIQSVSVRFRRGGEMACLPQRGHHTLKNLFQEWGIPPWERERIPLIFINEKLVSVVGYCVDPDFVPSEGETGWEIKLEKNPPSEGGQLEIYGTG